MEIIESQTRQFYRLLGHEGHWSQLHLEAVNETQWGPRVAEFKRINGREPTQIEFRKLCVLNRRLVYGEEKVVEWAKKYNGTGNLFIGRAPRQQDGSIIGTSCLSLDIDPQREKGTASSQAEWEAAIQAGKRLLRTLSYGVLCSSGNGALILFPLREVINKEISEQMGKRLEEKARELLKGTSLNVDATWDAPRLAKLIGSVSTKGDKANWRQARFIDTPNTNWAGYTQFKEGISGPVEQPALITKASFAIPDVQKGELDRSKADISLANRLKIQGFSAEDAYKSLCLHATREGREDDYKRIIQKVYFDKGSIAELVSGGSDGKAIQLWTPINGLSDYQNRKQPGEPELPTGFTALDAATFGLIRGHIFTVGARTNCGKTSFAISVASHLCGLSRRILFMSTETQYAEIWDRYIAASTGIPAFRIQHGLMSETDKACFNQFLRVFQKHQLFVYDSSRPSIRTVREAVNQANPDVLIFDYFQHVEGRETKELEEFVMQVKELAKEKQIAVLMCAQLHDGFPNPKTGKVPQPSMRDIKNCKVLNDESRVVILLDWDRDAVVGDGAAAVKVLLAKNKGVRQDCILKLDRSVPRFENE